MKIKLRASDSCERGHRHGEWALGSNVKLMAGIGVPVPSVNDGAIADRLGPPSESGRDAASARVFSGVLPRAICRNWEGVGNAVVSVFSALRRSRICRAPAHLSLGGAGGGSLLSRHPLPVPREFRGVHTWNSFSCFHWLNPLLAPSFISYISDITHMT